MQWDTPQYEEIDMNAEVGAYQDDFGNDPIADDDTAGS
jgi:hypothetical protein